MATQSPGFTTSSAEFAAALLAERELVPRARLIAEQVSLLLPNSAVVIYAIEDQESPAWRAMEKRERPGLLATLKQNWNPRFGASSESPARPHRRASSGFGQ